MIPRASVSGGEARAGCNAEFQRNAFAKARCAASDGVAQIPVCRRAFHVLHDNKEKTAVFIHVQHADEMRRFHARGHLRFAEKALDRGGISFGHVKRQNLHRDVLFQARMKACNKRRPCRPGPIWQAVEFLQAKERRGRRTACAARREAACRRRDQSRENGVG